MDQKEFTEEVTDTKINANRKQNVKQSKVENEKKEHRWKSRRKDISTLGPEARKVVKEWIPKKPLKCCLTG